MRAFKLFILFFLWFLNPTLGQTYVCPGNNVAGISPCSLSGGCIYNGVVLITCGDNSHYYVNNLDGGLFGQRTFSYFTLPIDDYIFLFGLIPAIYAVYYLRRKTV